MEADDRKLLSSGWKLSQGFLHPKIFFGDDGEGDGEDDGDGDESDDDESDDDESDDGDVNVESKALETYKAVHRRFPDNVECLKFLVCLRPPEILR